MLNDCRFRRRLLESTSVVEMHKSNGGLRGLICCPPTTDIRSESVDGREWSRCSPPSILYRAVFKTTRRLYCISASVGLSEWGCGDGWKMLELAMASIPLVEGPSMQLHIHDHRSINSTENTLGFLAHWCHDYRGRTCIAC